MLLYILLCVFSSLYTMDRQESMIISSSSEEISIESQSSEEDELFDFAVSRFSVISNIIKPYFSKVLKETDRSPLTHQQSNAEILKRIKSGDEQQVYNSKQFVDDIVAQATKQAFEEKEKELQEKRDQLVAYEKRIKQKYSGKKTALIAGMTATVATIVSTICTTIVTVNVK